MGFRMLLKKYANRRLYDTGASKYVTLEEVAERIRSGEEALVIDAATGADLTQATLTQIILESRGASKLLPVPLLHHLVRLGDDALGDFFGRWISWALEVYVSGKQANQWAAHWNPLLGMLQGASPGWPWSSNPQASAYGQSSPYGTAQPYGGLGPQGGASPFGGGFPSGWTQSNAVPGQAVSQSAPPPPPSSSQGQQSPPAGPGSEEIARLQRELETLRSGLAGRKRGPRKKDAAS